MATENTPDLQFRPLTSTRWEDFEALFGPNGACGGCWCMFWKQTQSEFDETKGERNREMMRQRVDAGEVPGILAYADDEVVGWCAVEPREEYPRLGRSPILQLIDDQSVWSIPCFFVAPAWRGRGVSVALLEGTIDYVAEQGGKIVEGYPVDATEEKPDPFVWVGLASAFDRVGFEEQERRSETRPIVRYAFD